MPQDKQARLLAICSWFKLFILDLCKPCWKNFQVIWYRLKVVLWTSETSSVRLWFGLVSIFFAVFIHSSPLFDYYNAEYHLMITLAPHWIDPRVFWSTLFVVHGTALLYGVIYRRFNTLLLVLEGLLGLAIWGSSALRVFEAQGTIGAHTIAACIALWILTRYPTHAEYVKIKELEIDPDELTNALAILNGGGDDAR